MRISYTVADTYEVPHGKFSSTYGSVALIDCHYLLDDMIETILTTLEDYKLFIPYFEYE